MRVFVSILFAAALSLSASLASAQSVDVESSIKSLDSSGLTITLADGKTYVVPEEFNFEGLEAGMKVSVFYTVVEGKRVVNDLVVLD